MTEPDAPDAEPAGYAEAVTELESARRRRIVLGAILFVLGFSAVFVAGGALFGAVGQELLPYQREISIAAGVLLVVMGVAFIGWVPVLQRDVRAHGVRSVGLLAAPMDPDAEVYSAVVTGLRGYATKNGFTSVVLGLSGGIDSALVAAIAADERHDAVHIAWQCAQKVRAAYAHPDPARGRQLGARARGRRHRRTAPEGGRGPAGRRRSSRRRPRPRR